MNLDQLLIINEQKTSLFSTTPYLANSKEILYTFIPAMVTDHFSQGHYDKLRKVYVDSKAYNHQMAAYLAICKIQASHTLGINEYVLPHLVEEYADLNKAIKNLDPALEKIKQWAPAYEYAVQFKQKLKIDFGAALKSDLESFAHHFDLTIDIGMLLKTFKQAK